MFALFGQAFSADTYSGARVAVFWAMCAIALLVVGILFDIRYIRIAKGLLHEPDGLLHPQKAGATRLLRLGALVSFVGIVLALLGAGTGVGVLVAKTV